MPNKKMLDPATPERSRLKSHRPREPLYERLANLLLKDITEGRLKPGDRLPTEAELSVLHGVSRVPVRHALDLLRQEGLIERFPSRGTFVTEASASKWQLGSVDDLARLGAQTEIHILDWRETPVPKAVSAFFGESCESVFRLRATRARAGLTVFYMQAYVAPALGRALARHDLDKTTQIDLFEKALGVRVERALEEIYADAANAAHAQRLGVAVGAPVLGQEVKLLGSRDTPLQISFGVWRADAFRRCYNLTRN